MAPFLLLVLALVASDHARSPEAELGEGVRVGHHPLLRRDQCTDHFPNCPLICSSDYQDKERICPATCGVCSNDTRLSHVTDPSWSPGNASLTSSLTTSLTSSPTMPPTTPPTTVKTTMTTTMTTTMSTTPTSPVPSHGFCFDHYKNCSEICASDYAFKDKICPVTCGACSPKPANHRHCFVCGDSNGPCSQMELVLGQGQQCTGRNEFCMTSLHAHPDGSSQIWKECVDEEVCKTKWYKQTSDTSDCMDVMLAWPVLDVVCHYCCVGDKCNANLMPSMSSLWTNH